MRLKNSKIFEYNKPGYTALSKSPIDTKTIYVRDSSYDVYASVKARKLPHTDYVRFFQSGQVLFFYDTTADLRNLNNRDIGIPGYYIIEGDKIKIDRFEGINGGQTGKYFGRIQNNGNIIFYETCPETYFGFFAKIERIERKSFWKKVVVPKMEFYVPNW